MAISEKDIFQSLMKDPNHAYNGIEKVWAEAQQRARQFRNNEKALSLGLEKSAMEKFSDFLTKADPTTFDNWFIDPTNNKRQNAALLKEVQKEVKEAGLTLGALHSNLGSTSLTDNSFSEKVFQVPNANGAWVPDDRENNASEYIKKHAQQLHDIYWGIENTIKGNELSPEQKRVLNQLHSIGNLAGGNSIGDTSSATDAFNLEDPVAFKKQINPLPVITDAGSPLVASTNRTPIALDWSGKSALAAATFVPSNITKVPASISAAAFATFMIRAGAPPSLTNMLIPAAIFIHLFLLL